MTWSSTRIFSLMLRICVMCMLLTQAVASGALQLRGPVPNRVSSGQRFSVELVVRFDASQEGGNAIETDLHIVGASGLVLESIEWIQPFTAGQDDLSLPARSDLPAVLGSDPIHLSNVVDDGKLFSSGPVARLLFRVPTDYPGNQSASIQLRSAAVLRGFETLTMDELVPAVVQLGSASVAVAELLFQEDTGWLGTWNIGGEHVLQRGLLEPSRLDDNQWRLAGSGDFDGDGERDLVFVFDHRVLGFWRMSGNRQVDAGLIQPESEIPAGWKMLAVADLNGDLNPDLFFQHEDGTMGVWIMHGFERESARILPVQVPLDWKVVTVADLNGDGVADLVLKGPEGHLGVWYLTASGTLLAKQLVPGSEVLGLSGWSVIGVKDFDFDGAGDLVLRHRDGWLGAWVLVPGSLAVSRSFLIDQTPLLLNWSLAVP